MKQSGTTVVFIIGCIGVLVAAFAIGICIRKIRLGNESITTTTPEKPPGRLASERKQTPQLPSNEQSSGAGDLSSERRADSAGQRAGMRQRFENMTDEEREAFRSRMRERFGGRRTPQLQLTDEERAKMREEIDTLRKNWDQMSEEEREKARDQISEKYGFRPRGFGGDRSFGYRGSGGRRSFNRPDAEETMSDAEQTEPNNGQTEPGENQPAPDKEQSENN